MFCELQSREYTKNHVEERISEGQIVVSDRQKFSTIAMCRALGVEFHKLYKGTYKIPSPGRVIYLRIEPEIAVDRAITTNKEYKLTRDVKYIRKVTELFDMLAKTHSFKVIEGRQPIDKIHNEITNYVFK